MTQPKSKPRSSFLQAYGRFRDSFERLLYSPVHALLLSIYFVFRLYAFNAHDTPVLDFIRPLLGSVALGLALYFIFLRIVRSRHTAAFMTSALIFSFYVYGLAWSSIRAIGIFIHPLPFAMVWALSTFLLVGWIGRKRIETPNPNVIVGVNLMAIILLLFPTIQAVRYFIGESLPFPPKVRHVAAGDPSSAHPDIYYIILDSYPRSQVLKDVYGYDNSAFLQSLRDMGFYVADCSQSNYAMTGLSLASSLNMEYVQNLSDTFQPDQMEMMGLFKLLDENAVQESVSSMGYKVISFASGFMWAEWRDADIFIAPPYGPMTEFETIVLNSSYVRIVDDLGIVNLDDIYGERYRSRTRLVLESFDGLAALPGPKFVYIHLIAPHPPYVFDENGKPIAPDQVAITKGYAGQAKFISNFILPGLKTLVEESELPPVIILQGDHGPWRVDDHSDQLKILNAYYLPEGADALYPGISPVNSFRVVFNTYFGTEFELLDDVSYYSDFTRKYDFSIMPNACP